jgi:putative SOS response-associated peptidase YedK
MCGRYGFHKESEAEFLERFELAKAEFELGDNWNVAPTQEMPVIERHSPNSVHLRKWGMQPGWSKMFIINAKIEKLVDSRFWNKPFRESRIIVPASYFIEWQKSEDGGKQPYVIGLKNKKMYGFAGLLVTTKDKEGVEQTGYVIITQEAGKFMNPIHHRQPAILKRENEEEWLNPDNTDPEYLLKLLGAFPYEEEMEKFPVSSLVNKPANNFPEILKPVGIS